MADYELHAYKEYPRDGGSIIQWNIGFFENERDMRVMRELIGDLDSIGWKTKVMRSTMLPWDINPK